MLPADRSKQRIDLARHNTPQGLLQRIVDRPSVARAIPRLSPAVLHRLVLRTGLEESGELLALATPEQLSAVFDLDLWRSDQPGHDELLDSDRFGAWLEALADLEPAIAARVFADMDPALAVAGMAAYVAVFDTAAVAPTPDLDGETTDDTARDGRLHCEVGGYLIVGRRSDTWDAVIGMLVALAESHHQYFHQVMRGCRRLSNSTPEIDGLDDLLSVADQLRLDVSVGRERRRERQGHVTPAHARAFLQSARRLDLRQPGPPPMSAVAVAHLEPMERVADPETDREAEPGSVPSPSAVETEEAEADTALAALLLDAGVLQEPARQLHGGDRIDTRFTRLQVELRFVLEHDPMVHAQRGLELAFLANVLAAGCPVQNRLFSPREAAECAAAVCNLGLDAWPPHWPASTASILVDQDLTGVFQTGWAVLHEEVCLHSASELLRTLDELRCRDRDIQAGLDELRQLLAEQIETGTPWHARDALDVLASLDLPAWAALLGLVAECPVLLQNVAAPGQARTVSPSVFEFVSELRQITQVRAFLRSLPDVLMR